MTKTIRVRLAAISALILAFASHELEACSRFLYETGTGTYIVGRSMDWNDPTAQTSLWAFPKGMQRDGGIGSNPIKWTAKYNSVIASFYDAATVDGMNEKGLAGNVLYLAESDYGDPAKTGKPTISIGAWLQCLLDNYATVKEAVVAMQDAPFTVVVSCLRRKWKPRNHDAALVEWFAVGRNAHHRFAFDSDKPI